MAASKDFSLIFNIGGKLNSTFSGALGKVTKNLEGIEKKAKSVGKVMSAMSAVGVAGIGASVKTAIDFEAAMSKVGAISRANKEDLDRLAKTARDLGATTAWTASQAADGMEFLAMAGFKTNDIISAMPGMLSLASAGAVELGVAADIASNILTGFGLKASDMGRVSDVMTNAFTQSNVTVAMLGDTMKYVAPVAESLGVSIETTAAMAGKLGDAGIQASMAGTAMRSIMGRLAAPPKAAAKALQSLNVQTTDAKGNLKDLPTILAEIEKKTSKMGNAQKSGIFKAIAGEEAFSAMSVLAKQAGTGELQEFVKKMEETGSANRVAKQMLDNTKGSIIMLKSALEGIMITVGNEFLPVITRLTDKATEVVSKFQEWSQANPELFSKLAKVAAISTLVVGALGALAVGVWALAGPIGIAVAIFTKLWAVFKLVWAAAKILFMIGRIVTIFNPIGIAITALIAVGVLLYKNWSSIGPMLASVWEKTKKVIFSAWNAIKAGASAAWSGIKSVFKVGINFIKGIIKTIDNVFSENPLLNFLIPIIGIPRMIIANWSSISDFFAEVWGKVSAWTSNAWAAVTGVIIAAWTTISNAVESGVSAVYSWVSEIFSAVSSFVSDIWTSIKTNIMNAWDGVISGIANSSLLQSFMGVWGNIMTFLGTLKDKMLSIGKNIIDGLIDGIKSGFDGLKSIWNTVNSWMPDFAKKKMDIHSPSRVMADIGGHIVGGLGVGIDTGFPAVQKAMNTGMNEVSSVPSVSSQQLSSGMLSRQAGATLTLTQEIHIAAGTSEEQAKSIADQSFKQFESQYNSMMNKRQRVAY